MLSLLHDDKLLTNLKKSKMGIGSAGCRVCGYVREDGLHVCVIVLRQRQFGVALCLAVLVKKISGWI